MKCRSPPPWRLRSPFGMADHCSLLADWNAGENQKDSSSHPAPERKYQNRALRKG
jgi:hypothetical protein